MSQTWRQCVELLESELSDTDLNTWIRPLQAFEANTSIKIMAPEASALMLAASRPMPNHLSM